MATKDIKKIKLKIKNKEGKVIRNPYLIAGFIEDKINLGHLTFRPGIRLSKFRYTNSWNHEPRFNTVIRLPNGFKLKSAWGKYYQYIISINSQEYELSQYLDYYYPLKFQIILKLIKLKGV